MSRAACDGQLDLFFAHECKSNCYGDSGKSGCDRDKRVRKARLVCDTCPVMAECRFWSVVIALSYGVAGGLTVKERRYLRRLLKAAGFPFEDYKGDPHNAELD